MKANTIKHNNRIGLVATGVIVLVTALGAGAILGYEKLKSVYLEQCVIADMAAQVEITSGKMVHPSTIAEELGLRVGANLALIDFSAKRKALLEKIPNLRSIRISRRLPDKVIITAEERVPVARLASALTGAKAFSGRVVDTEGMVFIWQRGTQTLPTIREATAPGTPKGQRITGRALAALRLIEASHDPEFADLGILEVSVANHNFLLATLGNYSRVKIIWEGMDEESPASRSDLVRKLGLLQKAVRSRVAPDAVIWNATMPDTITGDTQKKL